MTKRILLALRLGIAFSHAAFDDEKTTTGHRYSMNDDTKVGDRALTAIQSTSVFSKAVTTPDACTRVIPG